MKKISSLILPILYQSAQVFNLSFLFRKMETFWTIVASIVMLGGLAGCIVPLLPGPPLSYGALLLLQLRVDPPFTLKFLVTWGIIMAVVTLLDYFIPIWGTKKFGGSSYGVWGCGIGLLLGFFFGPVGIVVMPFLGALVGEWMANRNSDQALRAAFGSFLGFLAGTLLKLVTCLVMLWYFVGALL
ncbi:MAG: DUF456 domain-containing protein [Bacteroidota bacterium]